MGRFEEMQVQHIPREANSEADLLVNQSVEGVVVGVVKFQEPKMQGTEDLQDIKKFLLTGECPKHLDKVQRHRLVAKVVSYQLIGGELYHKGKDLVLRKVPSKEEINRILQSCHDDVYGGHFAQDITSRKILLAGYTWPTSLHRDVQHWCKSCKACQLAGDNSWGQEAHP